MNIFFSGFFFCTLKKKTHGRDKHRNRTKDHRNIPMIFFSLKYANDDRNNSNRLDAIEFARIDELVHSKVV